MESSAFGRLVGALVAPDKTFRSIAERPTWLLAFLLVCLSPLLPGILALPKIDWEEVARVNIERSGADIPPEVMEQQVEMTAKIGPVSTYLSPLFMAIGILLFAVVLWGGFTLAGGQPGFQRSLAVTSHALMPAVIGGLLAIPVVLATDHVSAEQLASGSLLQSSLAAFAPEGANPAVSALLSKIDVFSIWTLVLLVIGFRFSAAVKTGTAAITVGILWAVWVLFSVGLASLGMLLGGGGGS
jgi:hypothetical protein